MGLVEVERGRGEGVGFPIGVQTALFRKVGQKVLAERPQGTVLGRAMEEGRKGFFEPVPEKAEAVFAVLQFPTDLMEFPGLAGRCRKGADHGITTMMPTMRACVCPGKEQTKG